jgi:hypothetical protein
MRARCAQELASDLFRDIPVELQRDSDHRWGARAGLRLAQLREQHARQLDRWRAEIRRELIEEIRSHLADKRGTWIDWPPVRDTAQRELELL